MGACIRESTTQNTSLYCGLSWYLDIHHILYSDVLVMHSMFTMLLACFEGFISCQVFTYWGHPDSAVNLNLYVTVL